jgi:hypothetical protein
MVCPARLSVGASAGTGSGWDKLKGIKTRFMKNEKSDFKKEKAASAIQPRCDGR